MFVITENIMKHPVFFLQVSLLNTVTQMAVDAVQYISTDRTIKLAHEVARPSFRIVT
jgi:hypothetical protein